MSSAPQRISLRSRRFLNLLPAFLPTIPAKAGIQRRFIQVAVALGPRSLDSCFRRNDKWRALFDMTRGVMQRPPEAGIHFTMWRAYPSLVWQFGVRQRRFDYPIGHKIAPPWLFRVAFKLKGEEIRGVGIEGFRYSADILQRRVAHSPLYAGEVCHVYAGPERHLFLGDADTIKT